MQKSSLFKMTATCPEAAVPFLCDELRELNYRDVEPGFKAVHFSADLDQFFAVHLNSRIASNFIWQVRECAAATPQMLRSQAQRICWPDYFDSNKTFIVDATQTDRGEEFMSSNDLSKAVREAIEQRFKEANQLKPKVDLKEPDVRVVVYAHDKRCTIGFQTSGKALHKRGYKTAEHPAPLKETLAATILRAISYDGTKVLVDAMCGSGTLAIEAAMMAIDKAPLIHRGRGEFGFEKLKVFDNSVWRRIQDAARDAKSENLPVPIYASDIEGSFVELAKKNALRARVERYIQFSTDDFLKLKKPCEKGILVMNLPYGERITASSDNRQLSDAERSSQNKQLNSFYEAIGTHLKHEFSGWTAAVIAAEESPFQAIGLKAKRKVRMLNGSIPVRVLVYEMFAGKLGEHKKSESSIVRALPNLGHSRVFGN